MSVNAMGLAIVWGQRDILPTYREGSPEDKVLGDFLDPDDVERAKPFGEGLTLVVCNGVQRLVATAELKTFRPELV